MRPAQFLFQSAQPIWISGKEREYNLSLLLRRRFSGSAILRITGQSAYQVFIDGVLTAYGPARAAHGYHYVDEIPLNAADGCKSVLAILAYGGGVDCYAYANAPSFVCAELISNGQILAATGHSGFTASPYNCRLQKTPRFSFQRAFSEAYRFRIGDANLFSEFEDSEFVVSLAVQPKSTFLRRVVPYPDYERILPVAERRTGGCTQTEAVIEREWPAFEVFDRSELDEDPLDLARHLIYDPDASGDSRIWDFGRILTGFTEIEIEVDVPSKFVLTFDEILTDGNIDYTRLVCENVMIWDLAPGTYHLTGMEPNVFRYVHTAILGKGRIQSFRVCSYAYPRTKLRTLPSFGDAELDVICRAAEETFRQNAVDIFSDCPSRERAGWLCDSFFTARAEYALTGRTDIERAFLLNFILADRFPYLPEGMLPMCYPADHPDGNFIPNWAMWFVLQLEEYLHRSGDRVLVDAARLRIEALIRYFEKFENSDGLLEHLDRWVFVEWSRANDLVQDVNYPSNMLYAAMLRTVARLYGREDCAEKAIKLRKAIRQQARISELFCDNAIRSENGLTLSGECTETCQYYAFFAGIADPVEDADLLKLLLDSFGPNRNVQTVYPTVAPSNAFIGDYLRLELLLRCGCKEMLRSEIKAYFTPMARTTGTLWENNGSYASCNHGFASSVIHYLLHA